MTLCFMQIPLCRIQWHGSSTQLQGSMGVGWCMLYSMTKKRTECKGCKMVSLMWNKQFPPIAREMAKWLKVSLIQGTHVGWLRTTYFNDIEIINIKQTQLCMSSAHLCLVYNKNGISTQLKLFISNN